MLVILGIQGLIGGSRLRRIGSCATIRISYFGEYIKSPWCTKIIPNSSNSVDVALWVNHVNLVSLFVCIDHLFYFYLCCLHLTDLGLGFMFPNIVYS